LPVAAQIVAMSDTVAATGTGQRATMIERSAIIP
jgi:hypothetical protein